MSTYTKRAQVLFTDEQYAILVSYAQKNHKPIGAAIREVVETYILSEDVIARRKKAAERICSMNLPTADWKKIKKDITAAHAACGMEERE